MGGPDVMMLGTTCSGCGTHVQVQVPPWMLSAIEGSQQRYSDTWRDDPDHHHHDSSSGPLAAGGARAPRIEGQQPYRRPRQIDWRSTFVHTAIGTAHAIKASPVRPPALSPPETRRADKRPRPTRDRSRA